MAMTVGRLIGRKELALTLVAGGDGIDRVITWAHAIELTDPSPWLSGGELVMTTGLHLPPSASEQRDYVQRIVDSGSAALAFDTGVRFRKVPAAIRAAGDEFGIPVLAVSPETPFIAISRAVIDEITADEVRLVQQVVSGQEKLARATMRGGIPALVDALGPALNCTVCVLDRSRVVLAESGHDVTDVVERVQEQLDRDQKRRGGGSRVVVDDRRVLTIAQVPGGDEKQGYLVTSSAEPLGASERLLVGHALALLSIELSKPARVLDAEQRLRKGVTQALLTGALDVDPALLRYFGFAPDSSVAVAVFTDLGPALAAEHQLAAALEGNPYLLMGVRNGLALAVPAEGADLVIAQVYHGVRAGLRRAINGGFGAPVPIDNAGLSLQQALSAVRVAEATGHRLVGFAELGTFNLLLSTQPDTVLQSISHRWLGVLDQYDAENGAKLVSSLESFLHHNGHWEAAAAELGVHRHTLRGRMARVVELIGRDLDSAHTRSELWIALKARELLAQAAGPPAG
ncbi:PucR family transcriptional regulator [Mycobacterium sp. 21AC1]|uniref:PucR family transcriptional regulator n=1 Tax=[Mycobacterium] appelbergii TaxID=2939269 RepID=UPI002939094B|nr:PucR family transcriptional regulator [Mycobacterium sp. 21AC1]MDV3124353.1 PucR family transcriptional regulator [Mycobacterium sp. 21AC1]